MLHDGAFLKGQLDCQLDHHSDTDDDYTTIDRSPVNTKVKVTGRFLDSLRVQTF